MLIRNADLSDVPDILRIYMPFITDTCISFETEVPSIEEFRTRMGNVMKNYPYLVCEIDHKIVGYAYGSKHRERAAYKYSADMSIYVDPDYHRRGIGRALYTELAKLLVELGIYTAFAGITQPNDKSVGLHRALGFTEIGVYHNVGYKFDTWLDVMWMEKPLREYDKPENTSKSSR